MSQMRVLAALVGIFWLGPAAGAPSLTPADFPPCPAGTWRKDVVEPGFPRSVHCQDSQGRFQGPLLLWHDNGVVGEQGSYLDNNKDGWWSTWDDQGVLVAEREYWHGEVKARRRLQKDGPARPSQPTDPIHPCPKGTMVGKADPPGVMEQWCEKLRKDGVWVRQGPWIQFLQLVPSPVVYQRGSYDEGLRDGVFTEYWRNGQPREERHYVKGMRQGTATTFYDTGVKETEAVPSDDGQERRVTRWTENGVPKEEVVWGPHNVPRRSTTWYRNGTKAHEQSFVDGRPNRIERKWWLNGQLWEEGEQHEGTRVGTWRQWSPEGKLMEVEARDAQGNVDRQTFVLFEDDAPKGSLAPVPRGPLRSDASLQCPPETHRFEQVSADLTALPFGLLPLEAKKPEAPDDLTIDACGTGGRSIRFSIPFYRYLSGDFEASVTGGELHGPFIVWDSQGRKLSEEEYQHGKLQGRTVSWHESGQTRSITFYESGLENGPYATWYRNGAREVVGTLRGGKLEGAWFHYRENGLHDERGEYHEGKKNGLWVAWWEDGTKKSEQEFHDDKPDGRLASWDFGGELAAQGEYRAGVKEGHWIEREPGGNRREGDYKNGKWDGYWTFYDTQGRVKAEGRYEGYRRVGPWTLYDRGRPNAWGNYVWCAKVPRRSESTIIETGQRISGWGGEGCKEGVWTFWFDTGEVQGTAVYNEATAEGLAQPSATPGPTTK